MAKMTLLLICLITIDNIEANMYCQLGISLFSFIVLILVRAFKLWQIYLFDLFVEFVDLSLVILNIILIYQSMGDSYNTWMMFIVLFKSIVIFLFTLVYIFFAWKNWWIARRKGQKANPNVIEQ